MNDERYDYRPQVAVENPDGEAARVAGWRRMIREKAREYLQGGARRSPLFFRRRIGGNPMPPSTWRSFTIRPMVVLDLSPAEPIYIYGYLLRF